MTTCDDKNNTQDYLTICEASYSGNRKLLERLFTLSHVIEQVNYPDHEWGDRTALHLAASKGN